LKEAWVDDIPEETSVCKKTRAKPFPGVMRALQGKTGRV